MKKTKIGYMVRAYDKALKVFIDLKNNKRRRRNIARELAVAYDYDDFEVDNQYDADEMARDDVYYMTN